MKSHLIPRVRIRFLILVTILFVTATSTNAQEKKPNPAADRAYLLAAKIQNDQLFDQAEKKWKEFITTYNKDPRLPNAYSNLGACYLQQKKFDEAANSFRTVLQKYPKFKSRDGAQYNLGLTLYNKGLQTNKKEDLLNAAQEFAKVPQTYPQSSNIPLALYFQGECLYSSGQLKDAVVAYQQLVSKYKDSEVLPDAYYSLGITQQDLKNDIEAVKNFRELINRFPKSEFVNESRVRLAQSLFQQKKYSEAVNEFAKCVVIKDFPYADFAMLQQGNCLYEMEKFADAARVFEQLPQKFSKSDSVGQALFLAGKSWALAKNDNQAISLLRRAMDKKYPGAPSAAYELCLVLIRTNKHNEAETISSQAVKEFAQSKMLPELKFVHAQSLAGQEKKRKDSAKLFAEFSRVYPQHELTPQAYYAGAMIALEDEQFPQALELTGKYLALPNPEKREWTPEILYIAGESIFRDNPDKYGQAEPFYRKLIDGYKEHEFVPLATLRVGQCLLRAKKLEESAQHLLSASTKLKDNKMKALAYLLLGQNYSKKNKANEAVAALEKSLQSQGEWNRGDEVLYALSQNLVTVKRKDDAIKRLQELSGNYKESPFRDDSLFLLGQLYLEKKQYEEARKWFRQVVQEYEKKNKALASSAQHEIALSELTENDLKDAAKEFTVVLTKFADSKVKPQSQFQRGLVYVNLKQLEPAVTDFQAFLATNPDKTDAQYARFELGRCLTELKKPADAVKVFQVILQDNDYKHLDKVYYELGFAFLELKKVDDAMNAFRTLATRFATTSPYVAECWYRLGAHHKDAKELPQAIQAFSEGVKAAKDKTLKEQIQYQLGMTYFTAKNYPEAIKTAQAQVNEHSKGQFLDDATYLIGESFYAQDMFEKAVPFFEQIIAKKSKDYHARALYRCGTSLANLEKWKESGKYYTELVTAFPKFKLIHDAKFGQARALQNQNKLKEAVVVFEQITKETEAEVAAKSRFQIGTCEFAKKNYKAAIEHFFTVAVGYPYPELQGDSYYESARCFLALEKPGKAMETLQTMLKKFPDHPRAKAATKLLDDIKAQGQTAIWDSVRAEWHSHPTIFTLARSRQ